MVASVNFAGSPLQFWFLEYTRSAARKVHLDCLSAIRQDPAIVPTIAVRFYYSSARCPGSEARLGNPRLSLLPGAPRVCDSEMQEADRSATWIIAHHRRGGTTPGCRERQDAKGWSP